MDDRRSELRVQDGGAECILEASDEYRFVDERIERPAKPSPLGAQRVPSTGRCSGDDEHFEIGSVAVFAPERRRQHIRYGLFRIDLRFQLAGILSERSIET